MNENSEVSKVAEANKPNATPATKKTYKLTCSICKGSKVSEILVSDDEDGARYAYHCCSNCSGKGFNELAIDVKPAGSNGQMAEVAPSQFFFEAECEKDVNLFVAKLKAATSGAVIYHVAPVYLDYNGQKVLIPNVTVHFLTELNEEALKAVARSLEDCHMIEETLVEAPLDCMDVDLRVKVFLAYLDQCLEEVKALLSDDSIIARDVSKKTFKSIIPLQIFVTKVVFSHSIKPSI